MLVASLYNENILNNLNIFNNLFNFQLKLFFNLWSSIHLVATTLN